MIMNNYKWCFYCKVAPYMQFYLIVNAIETFINEWLIVTNN